ncbi:hypothetical protein PV08_08446 [Exophiala spinifera]|uniref:Major facilitator superfamily (MFS) profile domain-containing protein n=1 Tax=Exophiala spinifera TaxID=91928 RepID=A0A0D2BQ55_9EURO|nr:uncharacterized protein PV08_08446 [Exophiala spinifera]KIW13259.1 hypothetical protein PV08_08446 [Exophiala spinifera]
MTSFITVYQRKSNDGWLKETVHDVLHITPSLHGSSPTHVANAEGDGRNLAAPEDEDAGSFVTARSHSPEQRSSGFQHERTRSFSCFPSAATPNRTVREAGSPSNDSRPPRTPSQAHHMPVCSPSAQQGSRNFRFPRLTASSNSNHRSPPAGHAPTRFLRFGRKRGSIAEKTVEIQASVKAASTIDKALEITDPRDRRLSTVSEFSHFDSHPAVQPLGAQQALDEAACSDDENDLTQYPGLLRLALIVVGICLSVFVISLDRSIITTAIPDITSRFHSSADIGWYGSAYLLTACAFQPLYGRIYVSFATKSSYLIALAVFELGSLVSAISPSSNSLIIGRAIQGLGSAGLLTGAFVVGTHSVRLRYRPILFGAVGILYGVGALCGPLLGGTFADTIGWRWCFWVNLPIGGVTFVTVFLCFKNNSLQVKKSARRSFKSRLLELDIIGNIILLGGTTMLILALQFSEQRYSWSSARCVGLLCGFGATLLIFIAWVLYRGDAALIPPRIVRQRTVAASCVAGFLIYGALLLHSYYLPIWFQAIKGTSAIHSGVNMIPYMVANALFSLLAGIFVSKNGLFAPPAVVGCAIGTVGSGLLATIGPSTPSSRWIGFEVLISAGLGMAIQQGFSAVQALLDVEDVPIGTAAVVASQSFGGAIFVSVGNTLLQNHLLNKKNAASIPGVNIRAALELGATEFRRTVPVKDLPALISLYNDSLRIAFIAAVPLCGAAFICCLCMEWKRLGTAKGAVKDETNNEKV